MGIDISDARSILGCIEAELKVHSRKTSLKDALLAASPELLLEIRTGCGSPVKSKDIRPKLLGKRSYNQATLKLEICQFLTDD